MSASSGQGKILRRVGSGCLVENAWGEVGCLTNWHVFREIKNIPLHQKDQVAVLKKNVAGRDFIEDFTEYGNGFRVSWSSLLPGTKIVIGTSANGSFGKEIPHWSIVAEYPGGEYRYNANRAGLRSVNPASSFTKDGKGLFSFLGLAKRAISWNGSKWADKCFTSFEERNAMGDGKSCAVESKAREKELETF